jgi:hypothetical protein
MQVIEHVAAQALPSPIEPVGPVSDINGLDGPVPLTADQRVSDPIEVERQIVLDE